MLRRPYPKCHCIIGVLSEVTRHLLMGDWKDWRLREKGKTSTGNVLSESYKWWNNEVKLD